MKNCIHCNQLKDYPDLVKNKNMKGGYKNECKECHNRLQKARYFSQPIEERYCKYKRIKKTYGISKEDYFDLLEKANNSCEICGGNSRLIIDHCHKTDVVRGILCFNCNTAIGKLGDSKELVFRAIKYLEKFE